MHQTYSEREVKTPALTSLGVFFLNRYKREWGLGWVIQGRCSYQRDGDGEENFRHMRILGNCM